MVLGWSLPCVPTAPRGEGLGAAAATTRTAAGPVCRGGFVALNTQRLSIRTGSKDN